MEGGRGREREKEEGEREGEREKRKKAKTTKKGNYKERGERGKGEMLGAIYKQEIEYVCVNHSLYKYHNSSSTECTN